MPSYENFFLGTDRAVVELELFQVSHQDFSKTHSFVRNAFGGVTVTLEDNSIVEFEYYPARIVPLNANQTLEQALSISLGDLGELFPREIDAVDAADGWSVKPEVTYRTYRSDDLTQPIFGPVVLEVPNVTFTKKGLTIEAKAKELNRLATGTIYDYDEFPGLRGYL